MCIAAAIGGVASLGSAIIGSNASSNAADAQLQAANQANATQLQMYNQTRQDNMPLLGARNNALGALQAFYGLGAPAAMQTSGGQQSGAGGYAPGPGGSIQRRLTTTPAAQQASPYNFQSILQGLPGYQFQLQSGSQAVQRNLAAQGLLQSGAAGKALTQYGQDLGQNYANQYVGGLQSLAGLGMQGAQITAAAGQNYANQTGNNLAYAGNAAAAGYANQANAWQSGLAGIGQAYGAYQNYQQQQYQNAANSINQGIGQMQVPTFNPDLSLPGLN